MLLQHLALAGFCLLPASSAFVLPRQDVFKFPFGISFEREEALSDPNWTLEKGLQKKMEEATKITCEQKELTSVNDHSPADRWKAAHAIDVWGNLSLWHMDEDQAGRVNLEYSAWMADKIHAKENMACHLLKSDNGCSSYYQCDQTSVPAGHFILNSMISLNNVGLLGYYAFKSAS